MFNLTFFLASKDYSRVSSSKIVFPSHSFLPDTVEDLIRTSVEGASLEDVDARECGQLV